MQGLKWNNKSVQRLIKENNNPDPMNIIRSKAREMVLNGFEKGWEGPPFDPFKLARLLNISIVPNESISDARILSINGIFQIEYNPYQKPSRINFNISHELGHILFVDWHETIRNREEDKIGDLWELEFLCDIAASEILLPYAEFSQEANGLPLNMASLLSISNNYQASLEAVFLRFAEVVNKPCAILIASFEADDKKKLTVDYVKPSSSSELIIPNNYAIPASSKVFECINSGWTSEGIETWDVFKGIEYKIFAIGLPPLKKHKRQRVGVFIAPEQFDQKPEKSIYTVNGDATQPRGEGIKIIVQLVNTTAAVGFGFGRAMSIRWPLSKTVLQAWKGKPDFKLGETKCTKLNNEIYVFQILAQKGIKPKFEGESILSYVSLQQGLEQLKFTALELNASIHMPLIGAGQAKGDWNIIEGMIYDELVQNNISVTVYVLPGTRFNPKNKSPLSLFDTRTIYEKR
ncbi:ImmA/IrrE family metallo-endopeptidase [Longitalea luteola]|uniref:ImmA/IrrE family metallo-endopeptidase n=1 Tax=Longitalea luteola TaxID=2812563 RepID=UPI001A96AFF0|nr:ImmA/IrrE family metallo-endopeptidase [Longitalea luteola]